MRISGSTWERRCKVVFRFVGGGILKRGFCLEGGVVNFKEQGFKDF